MTDFQSPKITRCHKKDRAPRDSWITTHSTQMVDLKWSTPPEALKISGMRENACTYILYKFEWCMAILCLWNCHSINHQNMTKITWCSVTFCDGEYITTFWHGSRGVIWNRPHTHVNRHTNPQNSLVSWSVYERLQIHYFWTGNGLRCYVWNKITPNRVLFNTRLGKSKINAQLGLPSKLHNMQPSAFPLFHETTVCAAG